MSHAMQHMNVYAQYIRIEESINGEQCTRTTEHGS